MAITTNLEDALNNMCISAKRHSLGTVVKGLQGVKNGSVVVSAAQETAGEAVIATGLDAITGFIVQVYRANILLGSYDVQATDGDLAIATNGTDYVVTENDVINYTVY